MSRQVMQHALDALKASRDCVWMLRELHKPHLQYERHQQEYADYTEQLERHDAAIAALDAELKKPEVHGERLPQTRTVIINDRAFEITFVENGGYYFVPKEWLPPVRDAASLTYHFTQASRKAGDASQPEQCEWKYDENGEFRSACGGAYMSDIGANPSDYMTFCCGCGKKIKFLESEE